MPTSQLILLAVFGVAVLAWGAKRDIDNHRKEKETRLTPSNAKL
jgi:hypothetical protein